MQFSKVFFLSLPVLATSLGINCRGSFVCDVASFEDNLNENILQGLHDAIYSSDKDLSTTYNSGDHIICVSTTIDISIGNALFHLSGTPEVGGICAFGQDLQQPLTLAQIRPLVDALLEHGCKTCGSVPVHYVDENSNDPGEGILTFNFVTNDDCVGNCLGHAGVDGSGSDPQSSAAEAATTQAVATTVTAAPSTVTEENTSPAVTVQQTTAASTTAPAPYTPQPTATVTVQAGQSFRSIANAGALLLLPFEILFAVL